MSIKKDLIHIILMVMLLTVLHNSNNQFIVIICILLLTVFFVQTRAEWNRLRKKEVEDQRKFFIEVLTHDLKTPILAQLRGLELLYDEKFGEFNNEDQKEILFQIKESCHYVLEMISKILRIYKLEKGQAPILHENISLEDILLQSFSTVDPYAKEKGVEFVYLATGINTELEAEKRDIKMVIENLLMNAILYSKYGEKIFVKFEKTSRYLKFEIITKGNVLSERDCKRMFNISCVNVPNYSIIGQDISLYLCKIIADCHRGKVYAESDGEMYNKFTLELPLVKSKEPNLLQSLIMSY